MANMQFAFNIEPCDEYLAEILLRKIYYNRRGICTSKDERFTTIEEVFAHPKRC